MNSGASAVEHLWTFISRSCSKFVSKLQRRKSPRSGGSGVHGSASMVTMSEALPVVLQKPHYLASYNKSSYLAFADALKSCATVLDTNSGKYLHGHVVKLGYNSCRFVSKALLNMYAKCKALDDCHKLFDEITERDAVTWNILLSGYAGSRCHDYKVMRLFNMLRSCNDPKPSPITLAIVLPLYPRGGNCDAGQSMHAYALKSGMESCTLVGNALLSMYAKCGRVLDASAVFCQISGKDVVSYNAVIAGLAENNLVDDAFRIFCEMIRGSVMPNYATIANILPVCAVLRNVDCQMLGKEIHCYVLRRAEFEGEISVINALLSLYLRSGGLREAEYLFGGMRYRDLVSWNAIIAGYASNCQCSKALESFHELVCVKMFEPDSVTLISVLPVCAQLCDLSAGKEIHGYVFRHPALYDDTSVGNALINFYAKCCCIEAAFSTFSLVPQKDVITWNTMLNAIGINLVESQFVDFLYSMFVDKVNPDAITMITVVQFCAALSRRANLKEAHGFSLRSGILYSRNEPIVGNAFLDAYAKCGNMEYAAKMFQNLSERMNVVTCNSMISGYLIHGSHTDANMIFQRMLEKDLTTWNLMMRGYAQNECPIEAINLFHELHHHRIKPDGMTIMSLLTVCAQMASVHLLGQCHGYIVRACFEDVHLIAALIDSYSKCGSISYAYKIYESSPQKDLVLFTAMVGGFAMHGMAKAAMRVFNYMLECGIKPDHVVITTVLSACRHAGLIDEGMRVFNTIEQVHHMKPSMEQCACVVDLLGRGGRVEEAFSFINRMPVAADASIWGTLLAACKTHHDVDMGHAVADQLLKVENTDAGNYVVLSNLYAADARWDAVWEMRSLMKTKDMKKPAGCSWIEVGKRKNVFVAGDYAHPEGRLIYDILSHMNKQIQDLYETLNI